MAESLEAFESEVEKAVGHADMDGVNVHRKGDADGVGRYAVAATIWLDEQMARKDESMLPVYVELLGNLLREAEAN